MTSPDRTALPAGAVDELGRRVARSITLEPDGRGLRVALACSRFNGGITVRLAEGALAGAAECGIDPSDVTVAWTPGAFELPLLARGFATGGAVDAVVCLGAVIRGETGHYDLVAGQCAAGIQQVQLETGVPVAFGVLTTDDVDQALARSEPDRSNKGREALLTAVEMVQLLRATRPLLAEGGARRPSER